MVTTTNPETETKSLVAKTAEATVVASLVALWNVVAGPGMTERARLDREIAETRGYRDGFTKLV